MATQLAASQATGDARARLALRRHFTTPGVHPYDEVAWERRSAGIQAEGGQAVFEQDDIEVPKDWSQLATNVVASKYFRGQLGSPRRESSIRQLINRIVLTLRKWGEEEGYFADVVEADTFEAELTHLLVCQKMAFNSPVWFNMGTRENPQSSACQPYGALISTPRGMVPIGEIVQGGQVGLEVYDPDGVTRVAAVKANGQKPVFRVRLRNGSFVEATADHVVKAVHERRTSPEWMRVEELRPGMRMHLHPHRAKVVDRPLVAAGVGSHIVAETPEFTLGAIDELLVSEAALAGWLQADGFVGQYEHGTNRSLTIEFMTVNDEEHDWVMSHLDVAFPEAHRKVREVPSQDGDLHIRRIRIYGEVLREFVESWELVARGTEIRVPKRLWTASHDEISAYLRSIFQADGYVSVRRQNGQENGRVAFAVISEEWAEDVQVLLGVLGIYSRRVRKEEKREDRHDLHEVVIAIGFERARFAEQVGFVGADKQRKLLDSLDLRGLKRCPDLREEEIVAIEPVGVQEVYDIQTESGEYLTNHVAVHNCFILSVDDTMDSILSWIGKEGIIFKGGSGSGINLSKIRSSREHLSGGGTASGPVSFMRGADSCAGAIKSGGTTRRAAKMVILNCDHPDITDFVECKATEEKKAWALGEMGYDMGINGEVWNSIQFQNANNSVRVTDEFMLAVEAGKEWHTKSVTTGEVMDTFPARDLMRKVAEAAWVCGDPGMQYDSTINQWHTCPNSGRINGSNPCSEYMHLDDSACNLASLNLMKFVDDEDGFLVEDFQQAVDVTITAMDIIVTRSGYPTEAIGANARAFRQLGLGYANLGALLMSNGMPYDSDAGRAYAGAVTSLMTGRAYEMSTRLSERMGPFDGYSVNAQPMQGVMRMHLRAVEEIDEHLVPDGGLLDAAREAWRNVADRGPVHGIRNSQASVLAPTGTIGFMMDCDTTGVEPDIALVKYKKLVGGGVIKLVNNTVPRALRKLGYSEAEVEAIVRYVDEHETIEGAPELRDEHLSVFDCAFTPLKGTRSISHSGHIKMMGAVQPFISGAISKTVNMPTEATPEEIAGAYQLAWKEGVKALAIYRDGSKRTQPLSTGKALPEPTQVARPVRRRMPDEREAITHHFSIADHDGYVTVGKYEDGSPGEVFMKMAKQGSTVAGLMDSLAICMSLALQHGVPLQVMADKLSHMRFEPSGFTGNPQIPMAKSIVDYLVRWLSAKFLSEDEKRQVGIITDSLRAEAKAIADGEAAARIGDDDTATPAGNVIELPAAQPSPASPNTPGQTEIPLSPAQGGAYTFRMQTDGAICSSCGWTMIRSGSCYKCENCGSTSGCS